MSITHRNSLDDACLDGRKENQACIARFNLSWMDAWLVKLDNFHVDPLVCAPSALEIEAKVNRFDEIVRVEEDFDALESFCMSYITQKKRAYKRMGTPRLHLVFPSIVEVF